MRKAWVAVPRYSPMLGSRDRRRVPLRKGGRMLNDASALDGNFQALADSGFARQAPSPTEEEGCMINDALGLGGNLQVLADAGFARQAPRPTEEGGA